jgi:hypothetical protein
MNQMFLAPTVLSLRRYLYEKGIRLKPWFTQTQILDSLYSQLAEKCQGDAFWDELEALASSMLLDLRERRLPSDAGELASLEPAAALMDIRAALTKARSASTGFRGLAQLLPPASLRLLVAVSLCAVGCGGELDPSGVTEGTGAGGVVTGGSSATPAGGRVAQGGTPASGGSMVLPTATGGTSATGGTVNVAGAPGTIGICTNLAPDLAAIFAACGIDADTTKAYLAAFDVCDPSWATGVAAYFNCRTCEEFAQYLYNCYELCLTSAKYGGDPMANCMHPIPIYIVVLMDGAFGRCKATELQDRTAVDARASRRG